MHFETPLLLSIRLFIIVIGLLLLIATINTYTVQIQLLEFSVNIYSLKQPAAQWI